MNGVLLASFLFLAITIGALKDNKFKLKTISYSFLFPLLVFILMMIPIGGTYIGKEILSLKNESMSIIGTPDGWLSFFGGFLGGIVAVSGVYWQVTRKEKIEKMHKINNVKAYTKYIFNKIYKSDFFYKIHSELGLFHKNSYSSKPLNPFYNFSQEYFNSNIDTILKLKNGQTILEINDKVYKCSKLFDSLIENDRTQVEHKITSLITSLISKVDDDELKTIEEIACLNQSIVLFSNILQHYNNGNQNYISQLVNNFMNTISKTHMNEQKYDDIIIQLNNKNLNISTSLIALNFLLEMMREIMTLIRNITFKKRLEKFETNLEAQKIISDLEELSVEIFKLHDLYDDLSNESFQILNALLTLDLLND